MGRKGKQLTFGLIVVAGGLVALAGVSFQQNLVYYLTVEEYLNHEGDLPPQGFRIDGRVVEGSVVRDPDGLGVSFDIRDPEGDMTMPVAYHRELPDTFKEGGEVVIEGTADTEGVFQAKSLLAKCPSKYEKEAEEHPGEIPLDSANGSGETI
jgi:cytochrome c-type biogenesis protein CcmE